MTGRPGASPSPPSRRLRPIDFPAPRRRGLNVHAAAVAIAVLVPVTVLLGAAFLFGWRFQPVETGSMAPRYPAGSLAIVEPIDPAEVGPGMTIVFIDPQGRDRLVAHRAVKRLPGEVPTWQTQGDANIEPDPIPVRASAIQGRVRWAIPLAGNVVTAVRGPQAIALLVGLPLTLLVASEIRDWRGRGRHRVAQT